MTAPPPYCRSGALIWDSQLDRESRLTVITGQFPRERWDGAHCPEINCRSRQVPFRVKLTRIGKLKLNLAAALRMVAPPHPFLRQGENRHRVRALDSYPGFHLEKG